MLEKITVDCLSTESVSVKRQKYTIIDGVSYNLGEPSRKSYVNSVEGRLEVTAEIPEPFSSAILEVWGSSPTVTSSAS